MLSTCPHSIKAFGGRYYPLLTYKIGRLGTEKAYTTYLKSYIKTKVNLGSLGHITLSVWCGVSAPSSSALGNCWTGASAPGGSSELNSQVFLTRVLQPWFSGFPASSSPWPLCILHRAGAQLYPCQMHSDPSMTLYLWLQTWGRCEWTAAIRLEGNILSPFPGHWRLSWRQHL